MKTREVSVTAGSGHVFADLGFAEPEEELAKAQLAARVQFILKQRRLSQVAAAGLMGIARPTISALLDFEAAIHNRRPC